MRFDSAKTTRMKGRNASRTSPDMDNPAATPQQKLIPQRKEMGKEHFNNLHSSAVSVGQESKVTWSYFVPSRVSYAGMSFRQADSNGLAATLTGYIIN